MTLADKRTKNALLYNSGDGWQRSPATELNLQCCQSQTLIEVGHKVSHSSVAQWNKMNGDLSIVCGLTNKSTTNSRRMRL